jgi:hypothetical protein
MLRSRLSTVSNTSHFPRLSCTVSSDSAPDNTVRLYGFFCIFWRLTRPNTTSFRGFTLLFAGHLLVELRQNTGYLFSFSTNRFASLHSSIHRFNHHQSFKSPRTPPIKLHRSTATIRSLGPDPPPTAVSCSGGVGKAVLVSASLFPIYRVAATFCSSFVIVFLLQSGKVHSLPYSCSLYYFISFINKYIVFLLQSDCSSLSLYRLLTRPVHQQRNQRLLHALGQR